MGYLKWIIVVKIIIKATSSPHLKMNVYPKSDSELKRTFSILENSARIAKE